MITPILSQQVKTNYATLPAAKTIDDVENAARNVVAKVGKQSEGDLEKVVPYINGAILDQFSFSPELKVFIQLDDIFRSLMIDPTNNLLDHLMDYYDMFSFVEFSFSEYTEEFGYQLTIEFDVDYLTENNK